jgi:hypothetical protein
MPPLEISRATRRAVQLFRAWRDEDLDGIVALVHEAEDVREDLLDTVCGLLQVGSELAKAAHHDAEDSYLEDVLGATLVDEAMNGVSDG